MWYVLELTPCYNAAVWALYRIKKTNDGLGYCHWTKHTNSNCIQWVNQNALFNIISGSIQHHRDYMSKNYFSWDNRFSYCWTWSGNDDFRALAHPIWLTKQERHSDWNAKLRFHNHFDNAIVDFKPDTCYWLLGLGCTNHNNTMIHDWISSKCSSLHVEPQAVSALFCRHSTIHTYTLFVSPSAALWLGLTLGGHSGWRAGFIVLSALTYTDFTSKAKTWMCTPERCRMSKLWIQKNRSRSQ